MKKDQKRSITKIRSSYTAQQDRKQKVQQISQKMLKKRLIRFAAFVIVIMSIMTFAVFKQSKAIENKELEKMQLEDELLMLQKEEAHLENEITKLNDIDYVKKLARRDYFFSEDGEVIFQFADESPSY